MQWLNEPPHWQADEHTLTITTAPGTDFWRKTHYGFIRDNGHFYHDTMTGGFTMDVRIAGQYNALYDQAGVMVRLDDLHWIKCGIELVDGVQQAAVVVTHDFSDWSTTALPQNPESVWLRVKREGDGIEITYSLDGTQYTMLRLAYFQPEVPVQVGLMCCSPEGAGFMVRFDDINIIPG